MIFPFFFSNGACENFVRYNFEIKYENCAVIILQQWALLMEAIKAVVFFIKPSLKSFLLCKYTPTTRNIATIFFWKNRKLEK